MFMHFRGHMTEAEQLQLDRASLADFQAVKHSRWRTTMLFTTIC